MRLESAPVATQLAAFEAMIGRNPTVVTILERMPELGAPDCWLAAGALFQTVWNCLTDRDPAAGIRDYDLNYFDATDLSWEAEDAVIRRAAVLFGDLDGIVEVRNEARVHVWYEQRFGVSCPPLTRTTDAIDTFPNTSSCFAVRPSETGLEVYAPHGFSDLFALVARPNPVLAPRAVYERKTARWREQWPALRVLPWPA